MTTLVVVLKGGGEVAVYFDGTIGRAELIDEELEELVGGETDVSEFLTVKPLTQLPKNYRKRFNIVHTDPVKHRG